MAITAAVLAAVSLLLCTSVHGGGLSPLHSTEERLPRSYLSPVSTAAPTPPPAPAHPPNTQCVAWDPSSSQHSIDAPFRGDSWGSYFPTTGTSHCSVADRVPCYVTHDNAPLFGILDWISADASRSPNCSVSTVLGKVVTVTDTFYLPRKPNIPSNEVGVWDWILVGLGDKVPGTAIRAGHAIVIRSLEDAYTCAGTNFTGWALAGKSAATGVETFTLAFTTAYGNSVSLKYFEVAVCLPPIPPTPAPAVTPAPPFTPAPASHAVWMRFVYAVPSNLEATVTFSQEGVESVTLKPTFGYSTEWAKHFVFGYIDCSVFNASGTLKFKKRMMMPKGPIYIVMSGTFFPTEDKTFIVSDSYTKFNENSTTSVIRLMNLGQQLSLVNYGNVTNNEVHQLDSFIAENSVSDYKNFTSVPNANSLFWVWQSSSKSSEHFISQKLTPAPMGYGMTLFLVGFLTAPPNSKFSLRLIPLRDSPQGRFF